jgi:hypothetical protein
MAAKKKKAVKKSPAPKKAPKKAAKKVVPSSTIPELPITAQQVDQPVNAVRTVTVEVSRWFVTPGNVAVEAVKDGASVAKTVTDEKGFATLQLKDGSYKLIAGKKSRDVQISENATFKFSMW